MENIAIQRLVAIGGLFVFLFIAWLISENRRKLHWRVIISGLVIQALLGAFLLRTPWGKDLYDGADYALSFLVTAAGQGTAFLFGARAMELCPALNFLPAIIFISSFTAILFHLGVLQWLVRILAKVMVWVMDISGTESLVASANVFVGMTEAPLAIRPYLLTMTRSELMVMMTSGMATIAGNMMVVYAGILESHGVTPGHLLAASLISVPASIVLAKILVPETAESNTKGTVHVSIPRQDQNVLDAACRGATDGVKLAMNVGAVLIAFVSLIWVINQGLAMIPHAARPDDPYTLQEGLGYAFAPLAWLMGLSWDQALLVGQYLGEKTILNEFIAYDHFAGDIDKSELAAQLTPRTQVIVTYALCGFANFGSVAIMIGGIGSIVPERRKELAQLGLRSLIGGTLAAMMTANIAGIFF